MDAILGISSLLSSSNESLGTFFQMVKDVRAREEKLKQEVTQLKVVIDQQRRKKEVAELTENEFFRNLRKKKNKND